MRLGSRHSSLYSSERRLLSCVLPPKGLFSSSSICPMHNYSNVFQKHQGWGEKWEGGFGMLKVCLCCSLYLWSF